MHGGYASFVVNDLNTNDHYRNLPYVRGAPHFRFYAGTPLITTKGHRIGSLFIIEDRPRASFTTDEIETLGLMAEVVMRQLDLEREFQEHLRYQRMTKGLTQLLVAQSDIDIWQNPFASQGHSASKGIAEEDRHLSRDHNRKPSTQRPALELPRPPRLATEADRYSATNISRDLLIKAANLLRSSLDACRVLFLNLPYDSQHERCDEHNTTISAEAARPETRSDSSTSSLTRTFLEALRFRHSTGRVWDLANANTDGDNSCGKPGSYREVEQKDFEDYAVCILRKCLPHARSVMYAPLWESHYGGTTSTCLVVSYQDNRAFTEAVDLRYVRVFLNTLGITYSQFAVKSAEDQKESFLSSVSHELRTPLHGIIATTELLANTDLNPRQISLCKTLEMCGQTLFDTITQVIEHSKTSRDHESHHPSRRNSSIASHHSSLNEVQEVHQIIDVQDIATLCEDAVDVVVLSRSRAEFHRDSAASPDLEKSELAAIQSRRNNTHVCLHIASADWTFLCESASIRRIVMNLVANSLKFTESGYITIELQQQNVGHRNHEDACIAVQLSVKDSGRGISGDFLQNKLYVPFSQEHVDQDGLGLGLSIVSDLVKNMNGSISVQSELSKGTCFQITLPLTHVGTFSHNRMSLERGVHSPPSSETFMIAGRMLNEKAAVARDIRYYMQNWYKYKETSTALHATSIFVDVEDAEVFQELSLYKGHVIAIIDLANDPRDGMSSLLGTQYLATPIGPKKLRQVFAEADKPCSPRRKPQISGKNDRFNVLAHPLNGRRRAVPRTDASNAQQTKEPYPMPLPSPPEDEPLDNDTASLLQASRALTIASLKILCVDDNVINLRVLLANLKRLGYLQIEQATNGKEAVDMVTQSGEGYDIIFMDITMPIMNGFLCTQKIREYEYRHRDRKSTVSGEGGAAIERKRTTIIALTSLTSDSDRSRAFDAGVDEFVTKPLRYKELVDLMNSVGKSFLV